MELLTAEIGVTSKDKEEYVERLRKACEKETELDLKYDNANMIWYPQEGSQRDFLSLTGVFELLYEGTRGGGKSDTLLMSFAGECEKGYGSHWRGVLFRQTYPQLADIVAKILRWFPKMFGDRITFNQTAMSVTWDSGEKLMLRHMKRPEDYYNYHGHEYAWIGWEELTNWHDSVCYRRMMSCCRTTLPDMPRMIRATTNPYGVGHSWVKDRWSLPVSRNKCVYISRSNSVTTRMSLNSHIDENTILLNATPDYKDQLVDAARNEAEKQAWLRGDWDLVAGGMFDDIWRKCADRIMIDDFEVPHTWIITRSFDWGSSHPFAVGWYAESDGSDIKYKDGSRRYTIKGDIYRIREWYGSTGRENKGIGLLPEEISEGIVKRELGWGIHGRVRSGVADSSIFDRSLGSSIADRMYLPVTLNGKVYTGVNQDPCEKGAGSRVNGWENCRSWLSNTTPDNNSIREKPAFFVIKGHNNHFERTFPVLPRDEKNMDDVDTEAEDHIGDEVRYRLAWKRSIVKRRTF